MSGSMNAARLGVTGLLAAFVATSAGSAALAGSGDPHGDLPDKIQLTGVVRDFHERSEPNGHPDMERRPSSGFGHYVGIVKDQLGDDGKPVFNSYGYKVSSQWCDAQGRNTIPPKDYIDARPDDQAGSKSSSEGGAVTGADSLSQWFRDLPGVNLSKPLMLTLRRQPGTNIYTFDDREDPKYADLGGFFPINGELFGNSQGEDKNFHFTFELSTEFVYEQGAGQVFTFTGDDDVWVFIDGKLVIDIGGVHSAISQTIDLDRLSWLEDGETYSLKFFFCERHRTEANFRIDTTIALKNVELPVTTALFD